VLCISRSVAVRPRLVRRGVAATELGLILPLLTILALGCVDFGRFAYTYIAVTNAARAGASYGCMNSYTPTTLGLWQAGILQAAVDEMTGQVGFMPAGLAVTVAMIGEENGLWRVQVTASYPFATLVTWPGMPSTFPLRRTVVLRSIR
jgi:Flp pilus assembly protein TadG